jgi:hypothetical protein
MAIALVPCYTPTGLELFLKSAPASILTNPDQ